MKLIKIVLLIHLSLAFSGESYAAEIALSNGAWDFAYTEEERAVIAETREQRLKTQTELLPDISLDEEIATIEEEEKLLEEIIPTQNTNSVVSDTEEEIYSTQDETPMGSIDASILVGASVAEQRRADTDDPMQQVINYLIMGDPLTRRRADPYGLGSVEAFILSREQCVMGFAMKNVLTSDTIEMWFNNIDPDSIAFESRYVAEDVAQLQALEEGYNTYIKLSGYPVAITSSSGLKLTSEAVLLGDIDVNRAKEALSLLYREYCAGTGIGTAF